MVPPKCFINHGLAKSGVDIIVFQIQFFGGKRWEKDKISHQFPGLPGVPGAGKTCCRSQKWQTEWRPWIWRYKRACCFLSGDVESQIASLSWSWTLDMMIYHDISQPGSLRVPTIYGMQAVNPETLSESSHSKCTAVNPQVTNSFISLMWTQRWTMMNLQNAQLPANSPQKNTHNICRISDLPVETRRVAKYSWAKSLGHIGDLMNWQWKAWFSIEQVIYLSI